MTDIEFDLSNCIEFGQTEDIDNMVVPVQDVKEFLRRIINRLCYPNKPINTFEYAREIKAVIEDEAGKSLVEKTK